MMKLYFNKNSVMYNSFSTGIQLINLVPVSVVWVSTTIKV